MPQFSLALILTALLTSFLGLRYFLRRARLSYPPGPKPLPLIGNLFDLPKSFSWLTYASWAKTYGDVVSIVVVGQRIVILTSATAARELFEKPIYSDRPTIPIFDTGLMNWNWMTQLTSYGDQLQAQRRVLHGGMRPSALAQHRPMFEAKVHQFLSRLAETPHDFVEHLERSSKLQGSILMSLAYGYEVKPNNDKLFSIVQETGRLAVTVMLPGTQLVNDLPALQYLPEWFPGTGFWKLARKGRELGKAMADSPIAFVKESMAKGTAQPSIARDGFEVMQESDYVLKPGSITEEALRNACGSLYLAGFDTVVAALHSLFLALALHPLVQRKAQAEVDAVTGRTRLPSFDDQPHLPYVDAICKELVRWRPLAPMLFPHKVHEDNTYRGYLIPKGTIVMVNGWQARFPAILQDPERFPDPDSFKPERFLTDEQSRKSDEEVVNGAAFGFGRRHCPGRNVTDAILFMTVASLLASFDVGPQKNEHGEEIPLTGAYTGNSASRPEPFECSITPRD
ncbi:cytochrome P450 [Auriscalpium vulgare]|uniref:Cytochrome P450 n=1 Tax=Auriscalpium vulgare TaxID=40419 RepID=A0ACB8RIJ6_9AGAM|nr:cytochrome P450 [Auriscalpium vulgare]